MLLVNVVTYHVLNLMFFIDASGYRTARWKVPLCIDMQESQVQMHIVCFDQQHSVSSLLCISHDVPSNCLDT